MNYLIQYEADRSGCDAPGELVPVARFLVSTYVNSEGQNLWHAAYCCIHCGKIFGRKIWLTHTGLPEFDGWKFIESACSYPLLSDRDFRYFTDPEIVLNRQQQEFLIHEYSRTLALLDPRTRAGRCDLVA